MSTVRGHGFSPNTLNNQAVAFLRSLAPITRPVGTLRNKDGKNRRGVLAKCASAHWYRWKRAQISYRYSCDCRQAAAPARQRTCPVVRVLPLYFDRCACRTFPFRLFFDLPPVLKAAFSKKHPYGRIRKRRENHSCLPRLLGSRIAHRKRDKQRQSAHACMMSPQ